MDILATEIPATSTCTTGSTTGLAVTPTNYSSPTMSTFATTLRKTPAGVTVKVGNMPSGVSARPRNTPTATPSNTPTITPTYSSAATMTFTAIATPTVTSIVDLLFNYDKLAYKA